MIRRILSTAFVLFPLLGYCDQRDKNQYKLIAGADVAVCQKMIKEYNDDIEKFGIEQYSGDEFSAISWSKLQIENGGGASDWRVALIDIFNNGKKEPVIRFKNSGYGPLTTDPSYDHLIGKRAIEWEPPSLTQMNSNEVSSKTYAMRPRSYWFYYRGKAKALYAPEVTAPFIFDGVTYVSVRELPRTSLRTGEIVPISNVHLIVRYLGDVEDFRKASGRKHLPSGDRFKAQDKFFRTICVLSR